MRPSTEAELSEMIREAARPLRIRGGGTRGLGPAEGVVLETGGLSGVTLYEPGALTLVARAGTPLAEVEAVLSAERQRLAFEVPDLRGLLAREGVSTLGGVASANASGPRRVQVGAARDHLLGLRFVDGRGDVVKNGGRVMKNVTGYDLVKLLAGAQGKLGVLSEVSLKVQAIPEAEATLWRETGGTAGLAALRAALGSPFDVSGAGLAGGRAMIRLEGMEGSVAYRTAALRAHLGGEWQVAGGAESAALWTRLRDVEPFAGAPGAVWRLSMVPTAAAGVEAALTAAGLPHRALYDWGGGLVWLLVDSPEAAAIRALPGLGHATLVRPLPGMEGVPAFHPEPAALAALTAGLRAKFDPRGLFNPGIMD